MTFCGSSSDLLWYIQGQYDEDDELDQDIETEDNEDVQAKPPNDQVTTPTPSTDCSICWGDENLIGLGCGHSFCKHCVVSYLKINIIDNSQPLVTTHRSLLRREQPRVISVLSIPHVGIRCPHRGCQWVIKENNIKDFVDEETYSKFDEAALLQVLVNLSKTSDLRLCPMRCGRYIQRDDCLCTETECRRRLLILMEQRKTAEKALVENHRLFGMWASSTVRTCPHCCAHIEKNGGCNHMYCTRCKMAFNWSEAKDFDPRTKNDWWNPDNALLLGSLPSILETPQSDTVLPISRSHVVTTQPRSTKAKGRY